MSKTRNTQIVKPNASLVRPSYVNDDSRLGLEQAADYVILQRLKVIQKQADAAILSKFGVGDAIIAPMGAMIAPMTVDGRQQPEPPGTPFYLTPLFFFPDWVTVAGLSLKGTEPVIMYRTTDPADPVAIKAKNPNLRVEPYAKDPNHKIYHVEQLNFVVVLHNHDIGEQIFVINFSKAEHFTGAQFLTLLRMRNGPIFSGIYDARVNLRTHNKKGQWYGLDIANPVEGSGVEPWVDEGTYSVFKAKHEELKKLMRDRGIAAASPDTDDDIITDDENAESKEVAGARF